MIATLRHQAVNRENDLLGKLDFVVKRVDKLCSELKPKLIIVVQLAYEALVGLFAIDAPFMVYVTCHPTQYPLVSEVYGFPYYHPRKIIVNETALYELRSLCKKIQEECTFRVFNYLKNKYNIQPFENVFAIRSKMMTIYNYPYKLMELNNLHRSENALFLGASLREEKTPIAFKHWLKRKDQNYPTIYFSFGTYFSYHSDILSKIAKAIYQVTPNIIFSYGLSPKCLEEVDTKSWYIDSYLPQTAILPYTDIVICHGGNNTITEALANGIPIIVFPFASDQFSGAAFIENADCGLSIDPNKFSVEDLLHAIDCIKTCSKRCTEISNEITNISGINKMMSYCSV